MESKISFLATIANVLSRDLFAKSVPKCKYYKSKIFELFYKHFVNYFNTFHVKADLLCMDAATLWMHHKISY